MELIHTLNGVVINEPIGFDELKTTIKRHEYHGMSAEMSVGDLEYYGQAAKMIRDAYNTDIDTEIKYEVLDTSGYVVYSGVIDLGTYSEHTGEYFSVSCKVGEVGMKTTFNNRTEVEVDLNASKTIDGIDIAHTPKWEEVEIPIKHLPYTNLYIQKSDREYQPITPMGKNKGLHFIPIHFENKNINEYGSSGTIERVMDCELYKEEVQGGAEVDYQGDIPLGNDTGMCYFEEGEEFDKNFGADTKHKTISISARVTIRLHDDILPEESIQVTSNKGETTGNQYYTAKLVLMKEDGTILWEALGQTKIGNGQESTVYTIGDGEDDSTEVVKDVPTDERLYFGVLLQTDWRYEVRTEAGQGYLIAGYPRNNECTPTIIVRGGSQIKSVMFDTLQSTNATDVMLVHDALNTITEAITDNQATITSEWYGTPLSNVNPTDTYGGGSLKAITNGYKIRGLLEDRNMPISFKDMIESLDAIDCIGWGFVGNVIRVERWRWFYQEHKMLEIDGVREKERIITPDYIVTTLQVGYKKYTTNEEYNSTDTIHTERTFTSAIKATNSEVQKICSWIADNYAIEETRRASKENNDEFKYDENIFVFELLRRERGGGGNYIVTSTAKNISGLEEEIYNMKISPRHNAQRMRDWLFRANNNKDVKMTSSTGNVQAAFDVIADVVVEEKGKDYSLLTYETTSPQAENQDITFERSIIKAEELSVKYPITHEQYKSIMANPYGLVVVDGEECWIKEMTYSFFKEEAEFKLTPKAK